MEVYLMTVGTKITWEIQKTMSVTSSFSNYEIIHQHDTKHIGRAIIFNTKFGIYKVYQIVIITRINAAWYYIYHCGDWCRIQIRVWIRKIHPTPRPIGRSLGRLLRGLTVLQRHRTVYQFSEIQTSHMHEYPKDVWSSQQEVYSSWLFR